MAAVLCLELSGGAVWRNPVHPVLLEFRIKLIAVIRTIADEMLRLGFQPVEVETELHQRDLMMRGRMRTHGERESLPPGELRDRSQFVVKATSLQANQRVTAEVIYEREHLIPGEFGTAQQEFFKQNTLPLLTDCQ